MPTCIMFLVFLLILFVIFTTARARTVFQEQLVKRAVLIGREREGVRKSGPNKFYKHFHGFFNPHHHNQHKERHKMVCFLRLGASGQLSGGGGGGDLTHQHHLKLRLPSLLLILLPPCHSLHLAGQAVPGKVSAGNVAAACPVQRPRQDLRAGGFQG